jgi:hypothetical protein
VRPRTILTAALVATVLAPGRARADLTAFVGVNATPANRPVTGIAVGVGVLVVGVEFEYANTREDAAAAAPALKTGMFNLLVQTPFPVAGLQVYVGGGAKITLAGPLRLRLDYRIFTLRGAPRERRPQRFYAGLNLAF